MKERFNAIKTKIINAEKLTENEKQEFQELLWKLEKVYIIACASIEDKDLKSIIEYPDYKILEENDMKILLNRTKQNYHKLKQDYICRDFGKELKFAKVENFDVGYHKKTYFVILKDSKEKIIVLYSNTPLDTYKDE